MVKWEAPSTTTFEIARAFDKPDRYNLNRPFIMLLEQLGVHAEAFIKHQDIAEAQTRSATESLSKMARLMETHGLGTSFRLTGAMLNLEKLGIQNLYEPQDTRMYHFAVNHILRDLKHHSRMSVSLLIVALVRQSSI